MLKYKSLRLGVVLLVAAMLIWGCSDSDDPIGSNDPQPGPGQSVDYTVYSLDGGSLEHQLLAYKPLSGQLDSIPLAGEIPIRLGVSADGTKLYLSERNRVGIMDAYTHEDLGEIPHIGWIGVVASPDGKLLALLSDTLRIIDATSHELIYKEKVKIVNGVFSANSKQFVGADFTTHEVYALDLDENKSTRVTIEEYNINTLAPSSDGSLWFMYGYWIQSSYFLVYDPAADSILFLEQILGGGGSIIVHKEDKVVFFTPGTANPQWPVSESGVRVYDVVSNSLIEEISTENIPYDNDSTSVTIKFSVGRMTMTPDGRWLVLGPESRVNRGLMAVDLQTMSVARNIGSVGSQFYEPVCGLQ